MPPGHDGGTKVKQAAPVAAAAPAAAMADGLVDPLAQASLHAQEADSHQAALRDPGVQGKGRGLAQFKALGKTVVSRNRELKSLTKAAATSDVSTEENGGVLWSGDNYENGAKTTSAMHTAQAYAEANGKKTVEMTGGGKAMDRYNDPQGESFGAIKDRFKYLQDGKDNKVMRDMMTKQIAEHGGADLDGHEVRDDQSAAGAIWDVLSTRFATGLSGEVAGVHAYPESQHEALTEGPLAGNTYNTVEKPAVAKAGKARVTDMFRDNPEIAPHLQPPR